jgi:subtilisin family serine protease
LILSLVALAGFAPAANAGRIAPGLEDHLATLSGGDEVTVLVALRNPSDVDIPRLDFELHFAKAPMAVRHPRVIDALRDAADRTQGPLLAELESRRGAGGIVGHTPYWIVNGIVVRGTVDAIRELALRDDVDVIEANLVVELVEPLDVFREARGSGGLVPGVEAIEADRVWTELGITGVGAIVANMDTGVDGNHPALAARWRGNFAPASECWHNSLGGGGSFPTDSGSHGTHVMGTITGQTASDSVGVCPGALWIADNSIGQGVGPAFDNDVLDALEWFSDPDGNSLTLDDVPDVVQNSWRINEGFPGGYVDCDSRWWAAIDNCEAAGVVLTWSAGNEGPSSMTIGSPADRATTALNAFSVGSTQRFAPYTISGFSSRGPSGCPTAFTVKPEVVAPGSDIWSSVPGGGYGFNSGTSMSGPHVAGVVGLMRSANPDLDVETIKQVLIDTSTDLGVSGEDNTYGHGMVNAYEAVLAAMQGFGSIEGIVTDSNTGDPIEGVVITVDGFPQPKISDAAGFFRFVLAPDTYDVTYEFFGYADGNANLVVSADQATDGGLALVQLATARLSGVVRDFQGNPVEDATVTALATPLAPAVTLADGSYELFLPDLSTYDVRAFKSGLAPGDETVVMNGDQVQDFDLPEVAFDGFETGDFSSLPWTFSGFAPWTIDTANPFEGTYSAKSGSVGSNLHSTLRVAVDLASAGFVTFAYRVDAATGDFLHFYIDGITQASYEGNTGWQVVSFPISAGSHAFQWRYFNGPNLGGAQAAWVDGITLPPLVGQGTDAPQISVIPSGFALGSAFPNPTANATAIRFSVPMQGGNVDLSVFDVTGRRVQTLVSGHQNAGHHVANWDGTNAAGQRVASGTYFYRLHADGFEETKRLVRLR